MGSTQKARAPSSPSRSFSTTGDIRQTCVPSKEQLQAPADVDNKGGGSPEMERSLWVVTLRFHRPVLRDGAQSSHLTSRKTDAHREDGFHPHYSGYVAGPEPRARQRRQQGSLVKQKGLQECSPMFAVGAEQRQRGGNEQGLDSKCEQKNIPVEQHDQTAQAVEPRG